MIAVKCRACGEVNFVPIDRDFVQVGVPAEWYDDVVRLLAKKTKVPNPVARTRLSKVTDEQRARAFALRLRGLTVRQIMVEMNLSLGTTARILNGVPRAKILEGVEA
jgi:hypothetical protein